MNFVNLHGHTCCSWLDGYGLPEQICERIVELNQNAVAVTDHGNVFAHVLYEKIKKKYELKIIYGMEAYFVPDILDRSPVTETRGAGSFPHLTILAKNETGYKNLMQLHKKSWEQGFYYKNRIDYGLLFQHQEGLIVLSGCVGGLPLTYLKQILYTPKDLKTQKDINAYKENCIKQCYEHMQLMNKYVENYYAEFIPTPGYEDIPGYLLSKLAEIAYSLNIPPVITSDAHFPRPEDHIFEDVMLCVGTRQKLNDAKRKIKLANYHWYGNENDLIQRTLDMEFNASPEWFNHAIQNTVTIADQCESIDIPKAGKFRYIGLQPQESSEDKLNKMCIAGLQNRLDKKQIFDYQTNDYIQRAVYEFDVIKRKGFCDYLLAVNDIVQQAKAKNELVMLRGSAAGCLLLWLMGASETDPIKHNLSFERFFDENRNDPPDVDMDFELRKRDKHFEYVYEKYGEDNCAQISNVSTLKAKQAIQDVARVLSIPRAEFVPLTSVLDSADEEVEKQIDNINDPSALQVLFNFPQLRIAAGIVGQYRQSSIHAAGMIVSNEPLANSLGIVKKVSKIEKEVVNPITGELETVVTEESKKQMVSMDKRGAAFLGYLKMDMLSVNAYDVIAETLRKLNIPISFLFDLPLDDSNIYRIANAGKLAGIFQLSGGSALRVARLIGLDTFEDLYAASALCRPGPSELVKVYAENKHNPESLQHYISAMHPVAADIVKDTYGVMIYQEQVMRIARELAGLKWVDVHKLRKGIQDKLGLNPNTGPAWEEEWYNKFKEGCIETNNVNEEEIESLWINLKKYGAYGFNKCVTGDTVVIRAGSNQYDPIPEITIEQLFINQNSKSSIGEKIRAGKLNIMQMSLDGRIRPNRLKKIYYQGKQEVIKITTENGKSIEVTRNHRLLTDKGYVEAQYINLETILVTMGEKEQRIKKGYNTDRAKGKKYEGEGFWFGKENPSYIDGRNIYLNEAKLAVRIRSNNKCEKCEKDYNFDRFEFAHINSLLYFNNDYSKYNNSDNILFLCNSCHKKFDYEKGERKKRWSKGIPVSFEKVISISNEGVKNTYDIEMDTEEHNFIANKIVSHNSHACTYGQISYWMLWLKAYYTDCFYETYLQLEPKNTTRKQLVKEYTGMGGRIMLFDMNNPTTHFKCIEPKRIAGGFADLKGIGDITVEKALQKGKVGEDFILNLGGSHYDIIKESGALDGNWNVQRLITLAPWFPVPKTGDLEKQFRFSAGELIEISTLLHQWNGVATDGNVTIMGYVVEIEKDEERIWFEVEDEGGILNCRVPIKKVDELKTMFEPFRIGDYVAFEGWWSGEVLYIKFGLIALAAPDVRLENRQKIQNVQLDKLKTRLENYLNRWRMEKGLRQINTRKEKIKKLEEQFEKTNDRILEIMGEEAWLHWFNRLGEPTPYTDKKQMKKEEEFDHA